MLTPNDVRIRKNKIGDHLSVVGSSLLPERYLLIKLYKEVLQEIASGSIDPKSLAIAALKDKKTG